MSDVTYSDEWSLFVELLRHVVTNNSEETELQLRFDALLLTLKRASEESASDAIAIWLKDEY